MVTAIQLGNIFSANGKTVISGGGSGLDTEALIKSLTDARLIPATRIESQITKNTARLSAFSELETLMQQFRDAANFLRNPPGVQNASENIFNYRTGEVSSNIGAASTYLSATVEPGTQVQNYTINEISFLAQAKKQKTDPFAIANANTQVVFAAAGANQFQAGTITVNGENITLEDGDTLQEVADKFNAVKDDTGIGASILQVASGQFRLIFTATQTGESADFDFNGASVVDPTGVLANVVVTDLQLAQNAQFKIDNVDIERESNTIDDLIDGVTLTLKQTTIVGQSLELAVQPDTDLVYSGINNLLNAYNNFRLFYSDQTEVSTSGVPVEGADLVGNQTARDLNQQVASELSRIVAGITGNQPSRLADVGITFSDFAGDDETPFTRNILVVDEDKLRAALESNFDGVRKVFEFNMESSSSALSVFSRTNQLSVSEFSLDIDQTNGTYTASYMVDGNPATAAFTVTAIPGGGLTLTGGAGTPFEGLVLLYASTGDEVVDVTISQGIGDRLFNVVAGSLNEEDGTITLEKKTLTDDNTRLQQRVDTINVQVEDYREQLLIRFAQMEKAIASVNSILQNLDAQANAQLASR